MGTVQGALCTAVSHISHDLVRAQKLYVESWAASDFGRDNQRPPDLHQEVCENGPGHGWCGCFRPLLPEPMLCHTLLNLCPRFLKPRPYLAFHHIN
ncbi:Uncharacterized protein HZ326_23042 [Fusarium oxysporum f. sp. albedinis]|nr:Uncharacterized protein HZ326_23042 [Fusarium oxysporum f. sp. albedinis]